MLKGCAANFILCGVAAVAIVWSSRSTVKPAAIATITMPSLPADEYGELVGQLMEEDSAIYGLADKKLHTAGWPAMSALVIGRTRAWSPVERQRIDAIISDICWSTAGLSASDAIEVERIRDMANRSDYGLAYRSELEDSRQSFAVGTVVSRARTALGLQVPFRQMDHRDSTPAAMLHYLADLKKRDAWAELEWDLLSRGDISQLSMVLREHPSDADSLMDAVRALVLKQQSWEMRNVPPAYIANETIIPLLQAVGRRDEAFALAQKSPVDHFEEQFLAEREDWAALAKFPVTHDFFNVSRFVPAAALLYMGKTAKADALIDNNSKAADGIEPVGLQRQVVILGRIDLINKACEQRGDSDALVEFLLRERRYKEAMEHHSKAGRPREGKDAWSGGSIISGGTLALGPADAMDAQIDCRLLLALIKLNELDQARAELKRLRDAGAQAYWLDRADSLLGLPREKAEQGPGVNVGPSDYDPRIFGENAPRLGAWGEIVWRETKDRQKTLDAGQMILDGKMSAEEIVRLVELSKKPPSGTPPWYWYASGVQSAAPLELARIGSHDLAIKYLKEFVDSLSKPDQRNPQGLRSLTGFYDACRSMKMAEMADQFLLLQSRSPVGEPVLQYLAGLQQRKAGHEEEGKENIEEAELAIGGDIERRIWLAHRLFEMGENDLAEKQANCVTLIDAPVGTNRLDAHRLVAQIEESKGNFAEALRQYRLAFFANFYDYIMIPEDYEGFYQLSRSTTYCESRAALEKGDVDAAQSAARNVVALDCEGISPTLLLIAAFKQAGLTDQARSLADGNRAALESILKDFPNSHLHHFLIAKLDMQSGFTNAETQVHWQRARELAPDNAEYRNLK